jgi:RNA polymerase sigma factor (sigma-70 family)
MTTGRQTPIFQQLRQAVLARDGAGLTDAELMTHFVARRDGAALEALIRRHGSMVWSVCRRVLSNEQDAEDAFQASFLVFVRKAATIRAREQVGNWLYGVAYRTALKARTTDARRRAKERRAAEMSQPQAEADAGWSELLPLLDQELNRLPDKYRAAIVLCELEGRPRKEAARQLGVPEGTLSSRLATGRRMLAKRLGRPGLALSVGALATASVVVPPTLLASTVKAVSLVGAGQATIAGVVSVRVASLAEGVVKAMLLSKLSVGAALLAVVVVLAAGAGGAAYCAAAADPKPVPQTPPVAAVQAKERNVDKADVKGEEPPPWGEAVDGVQARLRPVKVRWDLGDTPEFILDMRNQGEKTPHQCRAPNFCEIEWDGQWYTFGGRDELECKHFTLNPGRQVDDWVKASLDVPWVHKKGGKDERLQVAYGKHTVRVAFRFDGVIRPISQPIKIEMGKESAWGEAVDGVQARIRAPKVIWTAGEAPTFILDLRNQGKKTPDQRRIPVDCQIELDKLWYSYEIPSGPYVTVGELLKPSDQVNDWTTVTPDEHWVSLTAEKKHFSLAPGKHTIRIAYQLQGTTPAIRPISGPVEIEVAKESAPDKSVDGVQAPTKQAAPAADANKQTAAQRAVDIRKKLDVPIKYEMAIDATLDKALDELLTRSDIPWKVNAPAFIKQGQDGDFISKAPVKKVDRLEGVPRRALVELLISKIESKSDDGQAVCVVRPDCVEITTRRAYLDEFYPGRKDFNLPPLVYALFDKVPLPDALARLGDTTGCNVILAGYLGKETETKVTADLKGVPLDTAVVLLADMADLKLVRLGNVYYVTSRERGRLLETEEKERRLKEEKGKDDPAKPSADKTDAKK